MPDLEVYDLPFSGFEKQVMLWVEEAVELRYGKAGDPQGALSSASADTPREALEYLRRVRQRADRIDELLTVIIRAKGRARRLRDEAAFHADSALTTAVVERASHRKEFSAASERASEAKLDSFEERRMAHQASRLVDVTVEAYDVINGLHWSLDAIRKDLRSTLNALQFESTLER